jgi:hypothetical protein
LEEWRAWRAQVVEELKEDAVELGGPEASQQADGEGEVIEEIVEEIIDETEEEVK